MKDFHPIQIQILRTLLFQPVSRFSDLNQSEITNDHFSFHVKKLLKKGYLEKTAGGYKLSSQGMELAGRIDAQSDTIVNQPKLGIAICLFRDDEVLLSSRLKDQAIGQVGLHTEKIRLGEKVAETVDRCIKKEIGNISYSARFKGVSHPQVRNGKDLELDVVLLCFRAEYKYGDIFTTTPEGKNSWVKIDQLGKLLNLMSGVVDIINKLSGDKAFLEE